MPTSCFCLNHHETYMHRCLQLAQLGQGKVMTNPMVGAVLVHNDRIIGEGYHRQYGGPHAEVDCIASVRVEDAELIPSATLYVSLEPCAHFGKTPPCADLVIQKGIRKVVIGCRDPFYQVDGKGIEKLNTAGVEVTVGILEERCKELNKRFFTYYTAHRPYITLKWAQSGDHRIAAYNRRTYISNAGTNRLVHRWRSEEASILVGTNTALFDDPDLTTRLHRGKTPLRLVVDKTLRLPVSLKLFNGEHKTIVFNTLQDKEHFNLTHYRLDTNKPLAGQIVKALGGLNIQSLLVEGGAQTLQAFIDAGLWDEARIITNEAMFIGKGIEAPQLKNAMPVRQETIFTDTINYYKSTEYRL
ncbi:MAG: diaminohydroxyphosphoribosylaminopyrimidine deaminase [Flaviaesturariibacter sp.]|nr:diaminohydroxyphosphoribosylaminopyrimidine deaminase [Flaviaesturariibacter sp.]